MTTPVAVGPLGDALANPSAGEQLPVGAYLLGWSPTASNWRRLRINSSGSLDVASPTSTLATSAGTAVSSLISAGAGRLLRVSALNTLALGYLQVFDGTALPTAGATPIASAPVAAGARVDWEPVGALAVINGVVAVFSSTPLVYTATALASGRFEIERG
jgi:hypothetical protein